MIVLYWLVTLLVLGYFLFYVLLGLGAVWTVTSDILRRVWRQLSGSRARERR